MDALVRLTELIETNPDMSTEEMAKILVEEGYAKSESSLHKFFNIIGLE
jgi:hypothetical protein